jgi:outer membrane protein
VEAFVKNNVVVTAAAMLMAAVTAISARAQTPQGTSPAPVSPVVITPGQRTVFVTSGPRVDLSIEEAVARARDKNIDIGVARITPRLTDFTVAGLEANYHVNLTVNTNQQRQTRLPTQTIQGITDPTPTTTTGWNSGFTKNMWWGGGNWNIGFSNSRVNNPASNNIRNPTFNSTISGFYVQPFLRGFKTDTTRASLQTNRISQANDEITLQSTVSTTMANTRNAYWDLVFAIQAVEAAQNSLDISAKLVQDNQARVEIGTLAPIDIKSAQAEQANRRLTLVQAQATVRTSELALKRLIVSGTDDPLWGSSINPVDRPAATPEPINVDAAVQRALRERTDLAQSLNNLKISDINLRLQQDQTRPQLNLTTSYGLQGIGGPQFAADGTVLPSGYFDALRGLTGFAAPQWNLQLAFAYPLGRSAQEAAVARSRLSLDQSQANLKSLQLQIATDVANAALTVQSSLESVQASATARELAQERLNAMQSKFDVGMSTNYEVVQAQRDFADAQNNELRALLNYRKALVNFETAQTVGTRSVGAAVTGGAGGTGTTGGGTGTTGGGTGTTGGGTGTTGGGGTGGGGTGGPGGGL